MSLKDDFAAALGIDASKLNELAKMLGLGEQPKPKDAYEEAAERLNNIAKERERQLAEEADMRLVRKDRDEATHQLASELADTINGHLQWLHQGHDISDEVPELIGNSIYNFIMDNFASTAATRRATKTFEDWLSEDAVIPEATNIKMLPEWETIRTHKGPRTGQELLNAALNEVNPIRAETHALAGIGLILADIRNLLNK